MTVEEVVKFMNEKNNAVRNERERIIKFIEAIGSIYAAGDNADRASVCNAIVEHLRGQ